MRLADLLTPALLLDLAALERNIERMTAHARNVGVGLRPHAKSHKSPEIAHLLARAGVLGPACATLLEAEAMVEAGCHGILLTSPLTTQAALARVHALLQREADLMLVVDDAQPIARLGEIAAATGRELPLVVELDVGVGRTGCAAPEQALALARRIAATSGLRFAGIQAYWGNLQQVMPLAERDRRVRTQAGRVARLIDLLAAAGLPPGLVTGGGTGTAFLDPALGLFTELQPGSFLVLDACYGAVPLAVGGNPFEPALHVLTAVVSASRPGRVIVDAGLKALATDSGIPVPVRGAPPGTSYRFMGDEHGALDFDPALPAPALGSLVELLTPHCDPTVNLYGCYQVMRGDEVVASWPILGRR